MYPSLCRLLRHPRQDMEYRRHKKGPTTKINNTSYQILNFTSAGYLSIRSTSSYVLLAANMDDFRSLAKKFVPENIAEQLIPPAPPILRDNSNQNRNRNGMSIPSMYQTEEEKTKKQKQKHSKKNQKHKKSKTKFDVQLDELVAKVKESLQRDWTIFLTTPNIFTSSKLNDDSYITTERMAVKEVTDFDVYTSGYSPSIKQVRYVKQDRDDSKDRNREKNRNVGEEKFVESIADDNYPSEVKKSKLKKIANVERQVAAQPTRFNKTRSRPSSKQAIIKDDLNDIFETVEEKQTEQTTISEDPSDLFKETDIRQPKDSYEEYVVPKKDEGYDQTEVLSNKKKDKFNDERPSRDVTDKKSSSRSKGKGKNKHKKVQDYQNDRDQKKDSDMFVDEDKDITSIYKNPEPNIDETINYNKKKRDERNKKKETRSISYYTPNQEDYIYSTSEMPQKWMNEFKEYHDQNHEPHTNKKSKQRYVPSRSDVEDHQKQSERSESNGPKRYIEVHEGSKSEIVAAPSSMYLEQDKHPKNVKKSSSNKKQRINKHEIEKKRKIFHQKPKNKKSLAETGTEDELHMFKGLDLLKTRDSYEDYVTPKKDIDIYDDEEPPKHDNKDKASINFLRELATNFEKEHKHDNDDIIDDYNKKSDTINDYDTTNYNKKRSNTNMNNDQDSDNNRRHKHGIKEPKEASELLPLPTEPERLLDYGELLGEPRRHVDEFLKFRKAKEGKVRAERFLLEEMIKEGKNSIETIQNRYLRS